MIDLSLYRVCVSICAGLALSFFSALSVTAQGIAINDNGALPDASAVLDVQSVTKGMLFPRMTTAQRIAIASPAEGLNVYDTDTHSQWTYIQGGWTSLAPIPAGSIVMRTQRNDATMSNAGFSFLWPQMFSNGQQGMDWRVPAPTTTNAPAARYNHISIWTGHEMIVWGGQDGVVYGDGASYNPATDTWTGISAVNAPSARETTTAVWTGSKMIVWGGYNAGVTQTGGIYDPATDTWTPMSTTNAPSARYRHTAVWTGSKMLVWGGSPDLAIPIPAGYMTLQLIPGHPFPPPMPPAARSFHSAIWTGTHMIVWGGQGGFFTYFNDGGMYNPTTDTWTPITTAGAPSARYECPAVWTGSKMIIWGGIGVSDAAMFDPVSMNWTSISLTGAPTTRQQHTAVWTGSEFAVFGGTISGSIANTGGLYNPDTDTWTTISTTNGPSARRYHTAVWTGNAMLVWAGQGTGNVQLQDGGNLSVPMAQTYYLYQKN
ncbi:MAG: hypothetical protein R3C61_20960 [Bacteroidia bacterium]